MTALFDITKRQCVKGRCHTGQRHYYSLCSNDVFFFTFYNYFSLIKVKQKVSNEVSLPGVKKANKRATFKTKIPLAGMPDRKLLPPPLCANNLLSVWSIRCDTSRKTLFPLLFKESARHGEFHFIYNSGATVS